VIRIQKLLSLALVCALIAVLSLPAIGAEEGPENAGAYSGYLFAKLDNIGTKSEGPSYYLQQFDNSEIHIIKNGILWQRDPALDKYLNTKVTITGVLESGQLRYTKIEGFQY
jgi:hypothetical protein